MESAFGKLHVQIVHAQNKLVGLKSWKVLGEVLHRIVKPMYKTEIPEHLLKCLGIKGSVMHCISNVFNTFSNFDFSVHAVVLLHTEH